LSNGLIRRTWRVHPNGACVEFDNLMTGEAMLRSVRPEARVTIDGVRYDVGGLVGQPNHAYLTDEWRAGLEANEGAFQLVNIEVAQPKERFAWGRARPAQVGATWPPKGLYLRMDYVLSAAEQTKRRAAEAPITEQGRRL